MCTEAFALRPFESTDADVVDAGEVEIEFGALTVERDDGDTSYITPSLIFNYGLTDNVELVGEFEVENPPDGKWELVDPGVFLKPMLRRGVLQDASGISLAAEFGVLLPATEAGDKDFGTEAIVIASGTLAPLTYHLNTGGGVNRDGRPFWLWGVIGEVPLSNGLTVVSEFSGENADEAKAEQSALLGVLYEPPGTGVELDLALRRGIGKEAPDWTVTFGFTFAF